MFSPQAKDFQFIVIEEEGNQKLFTFRILNQRFFFYVFLLETCSNLLIKYHQQLAIDLIVVSNIKCKKTS